jgi:DNA-binding NarL/FixJ family response regulator
VADVTRRQRAVIRELARDGADNAVIATRLGVAEDTVKSHVKAALAAVGASNRTHLVCLLLRGQVLLRVTNPPARKETL